MKRTAVLILAVVTLTGCGSGSKPGGDSGSAPAVPDLTGNWQIQTGSGTGAAPELGAVLLGNLVSNGNEVIGTFRYSNLAQSAKCSLNQVVTVSGSVDAARNLTLTSTALPDGSVIQAQLVIPAILTNFATGTIEVSGTTCGLASAAAIGVELAPLSGSFAGPLTPGDLAGTTSGTAGTGSLTLTEGATAAADGQFPVTGNLTYAFGSCTGSVALTGDHSGVGLTLEGVPAAPTDLPPATIFGTATPDASKSTIEVAFLPGFCASGGITVVDYVGTLAKQ